MLGPVVIGNNRTFFMLSYKWKSYKILQISYNFLSDRLPNFVYLLIQNYKCYEKIDFYDEHNCRSSYVQFV
jgi:hypothetical protein